jgi:tetratricopeptide (TPR) repeat protein
VKHPTNPEELAALHRILHDDPLRYLDIANQWIEESPGDSEPYFSRHQAWLELGQPEKALADISTAIALQPTQIDFWCRGNVYRRLGDYRKAAQDYDHAEGLDPKQWADDVFPLIYRADVYARLGDEASALDCCSRLPDDFWTPGHDDLPPGGKAEIAAELKRRASAAKAAKKPA